MTGQNYGNYHGILRPRTLWSLPSPVTVKRLRLADGCRLLLPEEQESRDDVIIVVVRNKEMPENSITNLV